VATDQLTEHPLAPFIRGTSRGPWLDYLGNLVTILASAEETAGRFSIMEAIVRKGAEPPRHVHENDDEAYYVLEGRFHFEAGGLEFEAGPGDLVFLPRGVPHGWTIEETGARTLWVASPGGIDGLFTEIGNPTDRPELPPAWDELPLERMREVLENRFLVRFAPRST